MPAPHRSAIAWTDHSGGDANFVSGCTPVSEGCRNCYAKAIYERFGRDFRRVTVYPDKLQRLLDWAESDPTYSWRRSRGEYRPDGPWPRMCFVCDTGDLFHEGVPMELLDRAFQGFGRQAHVVWQVLTKRPERMLEWYRRQRPELPPNVWLGVTAENQEAADERIPLLLQVPAAVRFVSVEPMLGPVDLIQACDVAIGSEHDVPAVDGIGRWLHLVICGAESGPNRRPFEVSWALSLYEQCRAAGVPYFAKQASGLRPGVPLELPGYGVVQEWPEPGSK
jgi:protein gp37